MKKCLSILLALILAISSMTIIAYAETVHLADSGTDAELTATGAGSVESAISWAISIANDNTHGYSQSRRYGPDYDCSSLVCTAFSKAGFNVSPENNTSTMKNAFINAGFTWIPASSFSGFPTNTNGLKRGDILLANGHTALYLGNDEMVHARGGYKDKYDEGYPGDQTGDEIAVTSYYASGYSKVGGWLGVLRYGGVEAVDLGSKFYANIVPTATDSNDLASTGANEELVETGAGLYTSIPSLKISRVVQSGDRDCHWCSMITTVGYALGSYSYGNYTTNYRIAGKDYSSYNDAVSQKLLSHSNSHVADSDMSIFPVSMKRESGGSIGNNEYTYKKLYNLLSQGKPISVYATGNSDHASVVIGYKENGNRTLDPSGFVILEVKKDGNYWTNSSSYYSEYANNPQIDGGETGSNMSCYVTLSSWLNYRGSNKEIKTICYPTEIQNPPSTQSYQNLGDKFYANIVPTGASSLAVTATSGGNVQLNTLNYSDYQKWYFERQSDKSYKITNVKMNKCLDVADADTADRTNIQVVASNNSNAQRWYFVKNGDGYWLVPKCNTASALDIKGSQLVDGANSIEYHINNTVLQRYSINKIHTLAYNANGGTGSIANTSVSFNQKFTINNNAFSKDGYHFAGYYYVNRKSDNTWYVSGSGWVKQSSYIQSGSFPKQYSVGSAYKLDNAWVSGAADNDTFTFYPQWKSDNPALQFYGNYSGYNYIIGGSFETITSGVYPNGSDNVYTLSADSSNRLNNQNSMKIVGKSAGNTSNDVRFYTDTARSCVNSDSEGDNKNMALTFWAKSSVDNTKAYFRWGYMSATKSITLTKSWKQYNIDMTKNPYASPELCFYFDKAGTFYINSPILVDGTTYASNNTSESVSTISKTQTFSYGGTYSGLPIPEREGYTFTGWYTAKQGGTQITESTPVYENEMRVYAHWEKKVSSVPVKTIEANGHRYELYDNIMGWEDAESFCESKGGHLLTIGSNAEQALAYQMAKDRMTFIWLGLKFYTDKSNWRWVTGETLTYTNWASANEGTNNTTEYYAIMYPYNFGTQNLAGMWADCNGIDAYRSFYGWHNSSFICEYDSIPSESIELNYNELSLEVDETMQLVAVIAPQDSTQSVIWTSSNDSIASVDEYGVVTAHSPGTTWISAITDNGLTAKCEVTVIEPYITPREIVLSASDWDIELGKTYQLYAVIYPTDADQSIRWYSKDESIATVDNNGMVTAVSTGFTSILAESNDGTLQATCEIYVYEPYVEPETVEYNGFAGIVSDEGSICIYSYEGSDKSISIPAGINGKTVTGIAGYLMGNNNAYTSVKIPLSVTEIGYHAIGYYITNWSNANFEEEKLEDIIIYGYSGTIAETYALENNFTFVSLDEKEIILGDADGDGDVSILDATAIQRTLAKLSTKSYVEAAADADGDTEITINDATAIQRYIAQLPAPNGIGKTKV